jgi:hypothetical protein
MIGNKEEKTEENRVTVGNHLFRSNFATIPAAGKAVFSPIAPPRALTGSRSCKGDPPKGTDSQTLRVSRCDLIPSSRALRKS